METRTSLSVGWVKRPDIQYYCRFSISCYTSAESLNYNDPHRLNATVPAQNFLKYVLKEERSYDKEQ